MNNDTLEYLLEESKNNFNAKGVGTTPSLHGLMAQQHPGVYSAFSEFFSRNEFELIIDAGTGMGGLTVFLASLLPQTPVHSCDAFPRHPQEVFDKFDNITFEEMDILNDDGIESLRSRSSGKRTCWLLDGGNKNKEFSTYVPVADKGDVLMMHDFARTPETHQRIYLDEERWHWHESGFPNKDYAPISDETWDYVEWANETILENCVWGAYKRI